MFGTSWTARRARATLTWLREWRLPGPERAAARSARAVKRQMHLERANQYRDKQGVAEARCAGASALPLSPGSESALLVPRSAPSVEREVCPTDSAARSR